jgi:ubiquitin-conjugating enzyme E2 Q
MESLTNSGWSPANTLESMIISIRAQLIAGGARLDPHNKHDYTETEAKEAFDRMVREHNW